MAEPELLDKSYVVGNLVYYTLISAVFVGLVFRLFQCYFCPNAFFSNNTMAAMSSSSHSSMGRKTKILVTVTVLAFAIHTWSDFAERCYEMSRVAADPRHDFSNDADAVKAVFSAVSTPFFIIGQLSMLYFFVLRLTFMQVTSPRMIRFLKVLFVVVVVLLVVTVAVNSARVASAPYLFPMVAGLWLLCYILLVTMLIVIFVRSTAKIMVAELKYYISTHERRQQQEHKQQQETQAQEQAQTQAQTQTQTGAETPTPQQSPQYSEDDDGGGGGGGGLELDTSDNEAIFNRDLIHTNIKFAWLSCLPLVSSLVTFLLVIITLSMGSEFAFLGARLVSVDDFLNALCIVLMLSVNNAWYYRICSPCHRCQRQCGFWQLFKYDADFTDVESERMVQLMTMDTNPSKDEKLRKNGRTGKRGNNAPENSSDLVKSSTETNVR